MGKSRDRYHGILPVNKPAGCTSHDVVQGIRKIVAQRSVGHTGTLDPAAEGLLLLCVGRATKLSPYVTAHTKTYLAHVKLGLSSTTFDAEGVAADAVPNDIPEATREQWEELLNEFKGTIKQRVPAYSAVRVDGERLHKKARRGEDVELPVHEVHISNIELIEICGADLHIRVDCGAGTYIRTLADDIGQRLGCGAYLAGLKRERVGRVTLDQAYTLEQLEDLKASETLEQALVPAMAVMDLAAVSVHDEFLAKLTNGCRPSAGDIAEVTGAFSRGDNILIHDRRGTLLAIGKAMVNSSSWQESPGLTFCAYDRVLV